MSEPKPASDHSEIARVHERLDELFLLVGTVDKKVEVVVQRCGPCQEELSRHKSTLYGNGSAGLVTRIATVESGRVDTLSIRSVVTLLAAVGTLAGSIAGAVGGLVAALAK